MSQYVEQKPMDDEIPETALAAIVPEIIDVSGRVVASVDGEDFCILADQGLKWCGKLVTIFQQVKKTRKASDDFLDELPDAIGNLQMMAELLVEALDNKAVTHLVRIDEEGGALPTRAKQSKIERYGLGPTIIRMRKMNRTLEEIAGVVGVSVPMVSKWLQTLAEQSPEQRITATQRTQQSVVKLVNQIESHQGRISNVVSRLEYMLDEKPGDIALALVSSLGELTKVMKLSFDIVKVVDEMQQRENIKDAMIRALDRVAPGFRNLAYEELDRIVNQTNQLE